MVQIEEIPLEFDLVLQRKGLKREVCVGPHASAFGNIMIEYFSKCIGVQVMRDRGLWNISLKDVANLPGRWFLYGIFVELSPIEANRNCLSAIRSSS